MLFPDVIKSALQKFHIKLNTILNGEKVKSDFLKLFKEATFLIAAGSLFQSAGAAAANKGASTKCRQHFVCKR